LTFKGGVFPSISLILATTFTIYGVLRKYIVIGAMPGLFIEVIVLALPAMAVLWFISSQGEISWNAHNTKTDILIVLAGPLTVFYNISDLRCSSLAASITAKPSPPPTRGVLVSYGLVSASSPLTLFGAPGLSPRQKFSEHPTARTRNKYASINMFWSGACGVSLRFFRRAAVKTKTESKARINTNQTRTPR